MLSEDVEKLWKRAEEDNLRLNTHEMRCEICQAFARGRSLKRCKEGHDLFKKGEKALARAQGRSHVYA